MTLTQIIEKYTPQSIKDIIAEHELELELATPRRNPKRLP